MKRRRYRFYALCALIVVVLCAALWISGRTVLAFKPDKTAHIFPASVSGEGWQDIAQVRTQELAASATFGAFSPANSAYIVLLPTEPPPEPEPEEPLATTTEEIPEPETPIEPSPETEAASSTEPEPEEASEDSVPEPEPEQEPEPVPEEIPAEENVAPDIEPVEQEEIPDTATSSEEESATTTSTTTDETSAARRVLASIGEFVFSNVIRPAFAQEEDIAACTALGVPCRTIELSGFDVGGLVDTNLRVARINFSFASAAQIEADQESRVLLRYFHEGTWREAGELFLNKEMSNAENGGYFTYELEDIGEWDDLEDVRVVIEYAAGDPYAGAEIYLDSVWIDAVYRERVQDILQGEEIVPEVPENVSFVLEGDEAGDPRLLKLADETIEFLYTDDTDDTLFMRSDGLAYAARATDSFPNAHTSVVTMSITNTGGDADTFRLYATSPESGSYLYSLEQFLRNVPRTASVPVYGEVTHACEGGWEEAAEGYVCEESGEMRACVELNGDGAECVFEEEIGTEDQTAYERAWVAMEVSPSPEGGPEVPRDHTLIGASTQTFEIQPGQTLYFRATLARAEPGESHFVFLAEGDSYEGDLDSAKLKEESKVARTVRGKPRINELLSDIQQFEGAEKPEFRFQFRTQRSLIGRLFNRLLGRDNGFSLERAQLRDAGGEVGDVPVAVEYGENGEWTLGIKKHPRSFRPGAYTLEFTVREGSEEYTETVEFFWGVLAVNPNKSVYAPNETALLHMAALDDAGDTICDAILELAITDPDGAVTTVPAHETGECGPNNVIESADYAANYVVGPLGTYTLSLMHLTEDGRILRRVSDSFEVRDPVPFSIERRGATRIWPVANYTMTLEVTAREDFVGQLIEAMPQDFIIVDVGGGESDIFGDAKRLVWNVDLRAGETARFTYTYDAPDISPRLYTLGPAEIRSGDGLPFVESRQWKLASDAVGNLLLYWDGAGIPSGWTCVSCAGGDAFFQRFVVGSSTPSVNGGAATHTHTATGNVPQTGSGGDSNTGGGSDVALNTHTHSYTPVINSPSNLPPYRNLVVIQANTTGEVQIPAGAIAIFDVASSSLPAGWARYAAQDGNFIRGESVANIGATGGATTHSHTITGTTGVPSATTNASGSGVNVADDGHTHTVNGNTASVDHRPPYREALLARVNATSTPPDGMIGMWTGDTFDGWDIVSGPGGAFENRFVLASTTYGATGGSETHTHADVLNIVSSGPSAVQNRTTTGASDASAAHTHDVDVTNFSTTNHLPPFRTAVFAKRAGGPRPSAPTIHTPFESEKTGTSTPTIEFTGTNPSVSSELVYQIQWDDDADLDVSPIGDRTSDDESGCSPDCFQNIVSGGDTSPFNEDERIRFTIQTPLVSGTTYYARVRAQNDGAANWGEWATTTSFTYVANTDPSQWFQTEDAQFELGTLDDTETLGDNAVRILTTTPVEALVAYGEGTVQTPRYQIWDGDSWGGELSAQSVGGTIQWVITKAAPTRDEYILGTQDASNDVNVQVYDGVADTWGDLQEMTAGLDDVTARGFDIAYESQSGDAIVVYCDGDGDPSYRVWNGASWVGPTTIDISLVNDCEYIKLASDPVSDELVLVVRDTAASTNDYEAAVWDGSAWGNFTGAFGGMTDTLNEGIAVEYEESGNQALVAVSNGGTSGFMWVAWNGVEWTSPTPQALGDDFEWGIMKRDVGSDNMALCYADQDDDLGVVRWDGSVWGTAQEFDGGGNTAGDGTIDGRPISCEFEITSSRDGYLMVPYSDAGAVQYQFMDDATGFSGEAALATINDSWTVGTTRTGEGKILMVAFDDANTQYDFSYWDGATWDADVTLEGSPSVTAEPFREPVHMAAQIYQPAVGTITSEPISFNFVPGQPTWGEALWHTTEPAGTDVVMQVTHGASCASLVPDIDLAGNSTGFQIAASPLDLSGLSTSTYSQLCLRATLTSSSQNNPTLDDWSVSWERQPYLTQTNYRWYVNTNAITPTDVWPAGATDISENDPIGASFAPTFGAPMRLRMGVLTENVSLSAGALALKLQYAEGAVCNAESAWQDVAPFSSSTALWRGYDNAAVSDGATLPAVLLSDSDVSGTYEEQNDTAVNPGSASITQEVEWDFVIQHNALPGTEYCFRAVTDGGALFNEYDRYPVLVTNQRPTSPLLEKPFDNERIASTTPWFEFAGEDPESNDLTYQVQVDDTPDFSSTVLDRDSQVAINEFTNIITPSDKDPFTTGQTIRYIPTSALSNGTTYYWRVRSRDRTASNAWSDWSDVSSVTVTSSTTITTWFQTTETQFDTDTHENTEPTGAHDIVLSTGLTTGTTTSSAIDFDWKTTGNAWGQLSWNDTETSSDLKYHIEYLNGSEWETVPDSDLSGNVAGFDTSPVSLLGLNPLIHNQIRIRANFTDSGASPHLLDWTVEWGFAVSQPTQFALFDNEKTGTTTPSFTFESDDPESNDLVYQITWSTTPDFTSSTTRESSVHSGFQNIASTSDASPFISGDTIRYHIQPGDALTNNNTYWWRVRARDPGGTNVWSVWSPTRSFTVDTTVTVSTWFQTTDEQFETDVLENIETNSDSVQITSIIREAFTAYAEGTAQIPRYRIWNGTSWGSEGSALSVGEGIRFVEAAAAPTRDEYLVGTLGATGAIEVQVFDGLTDTWGDMTEISTVSDITQRGFDIAYETNSGDALAVACSGTEATYQTWNGSAWSSSTAITLAVSGNCEWVRLATDPTSDEMIAVFRDTTTGATDFQALVWNGSSWGNSMTMGSQATANNEGIAVEYEESGDQALVVVSNGGAANFIWNAWNGSSWAGTNTVTIGDDFAGGNFCRDVGSDALALGYIDFDNDLGLVRWSGSGWAAAQEFDAGGNSQNGRPITCEFETLGSRDGFIMIPYSDTTNARSQFWNGSVLSGEATLSSITDAWEMRSIRTGDGNILVVAYDDANTEYDFSYWNGSVWSAEQVLETNSIPTVAPASVPIDIVARRYPAFTSGSVVSTPIDFEDGEGLKWDEVTWNDTTPGASEVRVQVQFASSTGEWELIPDGLVPNNSTGTTTPPIDLGNINYQTYNTLRLVANLACISGDCPSMDDWTLTWSPGLEVSGTAKQYDQTSDVTSGTVAVAVNGVLQSGKTSAISAGAWSIDNVTVFPGDVVTVFIQGASDANEAVAVTVYDGVGDVTGLELIERHLSIGSNDNPTVTNANLAAFDNGASGGMEDIFHEVDGGNDLTACVLSGCGDVELWVRSGSTFRPDSASSGNVATHDIEVDGTLVADGNTITASGSWDMDGTFTAGASTVVFSATSTTESVDGGASAFNNVTFGLSSTTATWSLATTTDVNGNLSVNFGTFAKGAQPLTIAGNLSIGASGTWSKGSATTTFDGTGTSNWTDSTISKQDIGMVAVDGSAKAVTLASSVRATNITIGSDDTLSAGVGNHGIEVLGDWTNNNAFIAQSGTVTFAATTTGRTITSGSSNFHNVTFNGVGGNWAFNGNVTLNNNLTIATGTVTLPVGTTTIGGNFTLTGGSFMHNNGAVLFNSSTAGKTIQPASLSFYDLAFNGSGSWSFPDGTATSSRNTTITTGAVTMPSGTFAVGGSFAKNGGSFVHNNGTLLLYAADARTVRLNNSDAYNITFAGSGSWSFIDTNATALNTVRFQSGTATLPSGTFSVGGSWLNSGGAFTHASGTVRFNSADTGETIESGGSWFGNLSFDSASGGWTVTQSATSTGTTTLAQASSFTLSSGQTLTVLGRFQNNVASSTTTWTGSTLALNSGLSFSINTKASSGDTYGTLAIGADTDVKMWNSSVNTTNVHATGSLYSQDHAAVDGDLYIWGEYVASGNEHWSYATDFDGTSIATTSRQVDVRFASGASFALSSGTFNMVGTGAATTTIANQGSGEYGFSISGGTTTAQYYEVRNTNAAGISLSGTTAVTSLSDGDLELSVNGGTSITLADTVINANPTLQIQRVRFETVVGTGANVTASGTPTSYWWFRNSRGAFDGEDFDNDPGGNPGNIRWDDSGIDITISGTVYSDHGTTPIGTPCDGSTQNVRITVVGSSVNSFTGSCDLSTGEYSIPNVQFTGDVVLFAYLDTNGGKRAVTVTKTPTEDITDFDLYERALVLRHEDTEPMMAVDLAARDSSDDSDLFYTAATSSLVVALENELFVWDGKSFAPGGDITLQSGGSGDARDGRLEIANNASFVASGAESHSIGGGLLVGSSATFTAASSTFTFTATTTGKIINAAIPLTFHELVFNGSGGAWSLNSSATTTVEDSVTLSAGTLSGSGNLVINGGSFSGNGSVALQGTTNLRGTGTLGGSSDWSFHDLFLGDATSTRTTAKSGSGTTTVSRVLRVGVNHTLEAGSSTWVLSGGGTPFVVDGSFDVQSAPFVYTATSSTEVADLVYASLTLAPSAAGTPTYDIMGGTLEADFITVGGANPVVVSANVNDPTLVVNDDVLINSGSTLVASNVGAFEIGGSWANSGTFTHSSSSVLFESGDTGETIAAGNSPFHGVEFDNASGGWTITQNATSTGDVSLTNAADFTVQSGSTLAVGGSFTNEVGGAATDWSGSTLSLFGTSHSLNEKTSGDDTYGTLRVASSTDVRMWHSSADSYAVHPAGSLYSQDHASVNGDLHIWGAYERSSGSDYWSYETDFDGTSLGGSPRQVDVRIASSSSVTLSGGVLDVLGTSTASTTIDVQGSGLYAFALSGGSFNARYYSFRNLNASGLAMSGSPTIPSLSDGDFELAVSGGSLMTMTGSVIDANPLKIIQRVRFATSTGATTGTNVTATGSSVSSWKFNFHYGGFDGEAFDDDPTGDPGYLRWDDSAAQIIVSGIVYSDEGVTVSGACDGSTPIVTLLIQGAGALTTSCDNITGAYSIPNISYNPGDTLTLFLNTDGGAQAVNVTADPNTNIANMDLYENRVIVRHEDTTPITIADLAIYDSDEDSDIPFDAEDSASDTLTLRPGAKLIVWTGKTFAPAGEITLPSTGSGDAWDGSFEVQDDGAFSAAGTQTHTIGGSFIVGTDASITPAQATFILNATTTGKTVQLGDNSLYDLTFDGAGGNWAFAGGGASIENDFIIATGTVTLGTATTTVGGSFDNSGGTFMHNNGHLYLTATDSGNIVRTNGSNLFDLTFDGVGGAWTMQDTNATSSGTVHINAGTPTLPTGIFAVGASFITEDGASFNHGGGTIRLTSASAGRTLRGASSNFSNITFAGAGEWVWEDATSTARTITFSAGSTTLPVALSVSGSFDNTGGSFYHNSGSITFTSTSTGRTVRTNGSWFNNVAFTSATGGWTIADSATSTGSFSITNASALTMQTGTTLTVNGIFTNNVGGAATTWTGSTLVLSGASSTINTKTTGDVYATLRIGPDTDIRMWNSQASSTIVDASGSLYSQDHADVAGDLYIWGAYERAGTDYWSYATDFDGVALGGASRQVDVRIASSSSITVSASSSLQVVGGAASSTSIAVQGSGAYSFDVTGGVLNAQYYQFRNLDADGLNLSGAPAITSLSNGDFELAANGGTMIGIAGTVIDANASKQIFNVAFATSSGIASGYNVSITSTTTGSWTFSAHTGNYDGEAFDNDSAPSELCGAIRWDDSECLFVSQEHYRWRNDDATEGAPADAWYNASWGKRQRVGITNQTAQGYSNLPVKMTVTHDNDMQADFDDLRFTDSTGTTSLDYWIEEFTSNTEAVVWVEVPSLPASGEAIIYMYYDNASVLTTGDGSAVFSFFDDFEDDNISEYSGDTSLFNVDTTFNYTGEYGLDAGSNAEERTTNGIYRTGSLTAQGDTIRFFQYVDAGFDDEPCAFFAVGGSGANYAVCLDHYPDERLIIAENITSNDGSGSIIASTTVDYDATGSGWYEVIVDWLSGGAINTRVYDPSGTLFATLNTSDGTRTSGGIGFGFWAQHGGWDFYSARDYIATEPTVVFGAEGTNNGASWLATEDTAYGGGTIGDNLRLRFSIQNTGTDLFGQLFRLQVAPKGTSLSCEAVPEVSYNDVPTQTGGCGSGVACMATSTQFTNETRTAGLLSYPADLSFDPGYILEDPSNQTPSSTLASFAATEVEYNFRMTGNAIENSYCFRVTNGATELENYQRVAEIVMAHGPFISNFSLNGADDIALTEGATTTVMATGTVTDLNGYDDIILATSTIYRSSVGASCSANQNSCYPVASCDLVDCAGTSCTLQCVASVQYFADPTDIGTYEPDNWLAYVRTEDSTGLFDTATSFGVELLSLFGLSVGANIDYGTLNIGESSTTTAQTTVLNTGNTSIDLELEGTDLGSIEPENQAFATSTFVYASCSICQFLTGGAPVGLEVDLPKPTSTSTPVADDVYWGINVPVGSAAGIFEGTNTFWATAE